MVELSVNHSLRLSLSLTLILIDIVSMTHTDTVTVTQWCKVSDRGGWESCNFSVRLEGTLKIYSYHIFYIIYYYYYTHACSMDTDYKQ